MTEKLFGEDKLWGWLGSNGFKRLENRFVGEGELVNWYAYRLSNLSAQPCETNGDKGAQITVTPSRFRHLDREHESVSIEICGEVGGVWWKLQAYSIKPSEVPERFADIEQSLVAAWNALLPRPKEES